MSPAKKQLLDALTVEQHNGGGWATPPRHWNAGATTAVLVIEDDDVIRARRRLELLEATADITDEEIA